MCRFALSLFAFLAAAAMTTIAPAEDAKAPARLRVYIGTATGKTPMGNESKGIYASELDLASGKLSVPVLVAECQGPSFLALHPDGKHLYAVGSMRSAEGKSVGALSAFVIEDAKTGKLKMLNQASSGGPGPCHLVVDKAGKLVLAANYGGGSCCAVAIKEDGSLGEETGFAQHRGSSVDPSRQKEPHAHSINVSPDNRFAFCADLGLDQVLIYKIDGGKLTPNDPPAGKTAPGSGPRHFAFHPSGKFAYVINELGNTVTAFAYNADKGSLSEIQSIGTLPSDFKETSYTAEVVVHPSGKFLYGSNRGQDSIAVFKVNADSGKLTAAGHQGEEVKWPRNFNVDPTGKYCLVCNEKGDSILVWAINQETGALTPTGNKITVGQPMCVKFLGL
ncbi:MAG: lactonase family protein [Pirellulaceae bacterium]